MRNVDALFLSDGLSFATVAGREIEKFCDPVVQALVDHGNTALLLNPAATGRQSSATNTVAVRSLLDTARARQRLKGFFYGRVEQPVLPGYAEFANWIAGLHDLKVMTQGDLVIATRTITAYAGVFEKIIRRTGSRIGFLCSYYCNEGYAFVLACRNTGQMAVDIQHGVGDDVHLAYVGWNRSPNAGYALIPSGFWCWSENDVAEISRWTRRHTDGHRPILGTNLLLEGYRSGRIVASKDEDVLLRRLTGQDAPSSCARARRHALVSLQPNYVTDPKWREWLHCLMKSAGDNVCWWMRLHPGMLDSFNLAESLAPAGVNVDFRASSTLPLYLLLAHADVHLTHCSSTVIEAAGFGVHSLLLSQLGADYFARLAAAGHATQVFPESDFPEVFGRALASKVPQEAARLQAGLRLDRATRILNELVDAA